jgi:hypothetical protein
MQKNNPELIENLTHYFVTRQEVHTGGGGVLPAAGNQYYHLEDNGVTWVSVNDLTMNDDAYIGLPGGGRLVFDSTPAPDQIVLTSGDLNLNGGDLYVPDNAADALTLYDDGGLNYLRIISTNAQPVIKFNDGGLDVDFHVEATGVADALQVQGSDGQITLGALGAGAVQSNVGGVLSSGPLPLTDLASWAQGAIIRGGAADWEAYAHPGAAGYALTTDATDVIWDQTPNWSGLHNFDAGLEVSDDQPLNFGDGADGVGQYVSGNNQVEWTGVNWLFDSVDVSLKSSNSTWPTLEIENTNADALSGRLQFYKNGASPADDDDLGIIEFYGDTSTGAKGQFAFILSESLDVTNGDIGGSLTFSVAMDTTQRNLLQLSGYNGVVGQGEVLVNNDERDVDFCVKTSADADALEVRGSDSQITLGGLGAGFVQSDAGGVLSSAAIAAGDLPAHTHSGAGQGGSLVVGTTDTNATAGSVFFAGAAGVIQQDNANLFWDDTNNELGIGTNSPDGTLHVHTASAGAVIASALADDLVVENSGQGGATFLVPDANVSNLVFGTTSQNQGAWVLWDYTNLKMRIGPTTANGILELASNNNIVRLTVEASGNLLLDGTATLDLNGNADALIFDADGDTTISAPNDDQLDIEVGGSDIAHFTATGLGIFESSPAVALHVLGDGQFDDTANDAGSAAFFGYKDRAGAIVQNGDRVFAFSGFGYDGAAYQIAAAFQVRVDGVPGLGSVPGLWRFRANDGTGLQNLLEIKGSNGRVGVRTTAPAAQLHVDQPDTAAAIPVLLLDQADIDQPFIDFTGGTIYTGLSGQDEYIKVITSSGTRYLRLFA